MSIIYTRTLGSGLSLFIEPMPGMKSVGLSWILGAGTAAEPEGRAGLAAVTSEMLLRGGGIRDSRRFADDLDRIGASRTVDPTSRTMHIRSSTLGDKLGEVLPMITDVVLRPRFDTTTLEPARELAEQGLESLEDDPREKASIEAKRRHFPAPYNRSIYGNAEGLALITLDDVQKFWSTNAVPQGSVLAIAGDVEPEKVADQFESLLSGWSGDAAPEHDETAPVRGASHTEDDSNQVQIILLAEGPNERDERSALLTKFAVNVLSGGMSGRLFTEVREKRGLCYAVSAGFRGDDRFGVISAYVGTAPDRAQQSLDVLVAEMQKLFTPEGRVTPEEFARARIGMKSNVVFHGESSSGRAGAISGDMKRLGRVRTLDEILTTLESVTLDELNAYLSTCSLRGVTLQTLGSVQLTPPDSLGL
ncbi:MAG: insulinase family protein [Phycisphaerales bacterium]|nr:insulinase family protein [Phycisphaerales bacterium]MCB9837078.1 insulinase family protein [Phycisphaera sp.]